MFVDTNVLVYATRPASRFRERAVAALEATSHAGSFVISRQILREYLAVVTRPGGASAPLTIAEALSDVARFTTIFDILEDGPEVTAQLVALCGAVKVAGRQVHDANIVATMLAHGETRLLTANVADFRRFEPSIQVIVP